MALFAERGYDNVSAAEVAQHASVSRRSLFRYFPTKGDLVWDGFASSLTVLQRALEERRHGEARRAAVESLVVVAEQIPDLRLTRTRLRIIADNQDLIAFGHGHLQRQGAMLRDFLVDHGYDPLVARVNANALSIGAFSGYLHWATETNDPTPVETVRRALDGLELGR